MPELPPLKKVVQGNEAIEYSGITRAHAAAFQRLAEKLRWFFIFRGVNPDATVLIDDNYPTKDMGVHGKSSDWGPQAGFLCLNQYFSKIVGKGAAAVNGANEESPLSLEHGYPAVPLVLSKKSVAALIKRGRMMQVADARGIVMESVTGKNGPAHRFTLHPVRDESIERLAVELAAIHYTKPREIRNPITTKTQLKEYLDNVVATIASLGRPAGSEGGPYDHLFFVQTDSEQKGYHSWYNGERGKFLLVLATTGEHRYSRKVAEHGVPGVSSSPSGPKAGKFSLPLTADYDIFAVCPPLAHLNLDLGTTRPARKEGDKQAVKKAALQNMKQAALGIRHLESTEQWGTLTNYHLYGILRLNEAAKSAGYRGGFVCHHGAEQENLFYSEVDGVYTIFSPSGQVYAAPPSEIERALADIDRLGHVYYTNPSYIVKSAAGSDKSFYRGTPEENNVEKKVVRAYDVGGKLQEKELVAIVYHNRRTADSLAAAEVSGDEPVRLSCLGREFFWRAHYRSPTAVLRSPLVELPALRAQWDELMDFKPGDHHNRVVKVGVHRPPLPNFKGEFEGIAKLVDELVAAGMPPAALEVVVSALTGAGDKAEERTPLAHRKAGKAWFTLWDLIRKDDRRLGLLVAASIQKDEEVRRRKRKLGRVLDARASPAHPEESASLPPLAPAQHHPSLTQLADPTQQEFTPRQRELLEWAARTKRGEGLEKYDLPPKRPPGL